MVYKTLVSTFVLEWFCSYTSALAIKSEASFVTASMILLFWQMFRILNRSGFLSLRGEKSRIMVAGKSNIKSSRGAVISSWGSEEQLEPRAKQTCVHQELQWETREKYIETYTPSFFTILNTPGFCITLLLAVQKICIMICVTWKVFFSILVGTSTASRVRAR